MEYMFFDTMRNEEVTRVTFEHVPSTLELQIKYSELMQNYKFRQGRCTLVPVPPQMLHADA